MLFSSASSHPCYRNLYHHHHHHHHRGRRSYGRGWIMDGFCGYILIGLILGCQIVITSTNFSGSSHQNSFYVSMIRSPESTIAPQGDEVLFECQLNLAPDQLEWRFRPSNFDQNSRKFIYLNNNTIGSISNEGGTSKLRINVNSDTIGEYRCIAWFGASAIASVPAQLTLASIKLNENDYNVNSNNLDHRGGMGIDHVVRWHVSPKNTIFIRCGSVISSPPPVWRFYKNDVPIPKPESTLPSDALVLHSVTFNDSGVYLCSAVNTITSSEVKIPRKIQLIVENTEQKAPYFLAEPPKRYTVAPGQNIVLECPGVGNPAPKAVWSSPDFNMSNDRFTQLEYGMQIMNVRPEDQGRYVCRLDNGIAPVVIHTINVEVSPRLDALEAPVILKGPRSTLTNESDSLELDCIAQGSPLPEIYWMINGEDTRWDPHIQQDGSKLLIKSVEKTHAGIVQCFAKNKIGEVTESNLLQVNPKQIRGEVGVQPLGQFPTKTSNEHGGKQNKGRKKHRTPNMVPPSRPNVTRLSDDAVMIRWSVSKNEGLPIQFFKVQYRSHGNPAKKIPPENWQTTNDDIPYGKRDKNSGGGKNFTSAVRGLKPDRFYRFRIIAVYSNNDNKEGNSSGKFFLQRASQLGPSRGHIPSPILSKIEAVSETEIALYWSFPSNETNSIDGFYIHYRPASTAGDYFKTTVDGGDVRYFQIDMLEADTAYEFKLQSFTSSTASDFSSILTGKTLKSTTPPPPQTPSVVPASDASEDSNPMLPVIAGAALGVILLIAAPLALCFCLKRKKAPRDDENKEHIQADTNHFVPSSVLGNQHHKGSHRMNGVMPRMNITANPLAQEGDKNRNVMELRFIPTPGGNNQHLQPLSSGTDIPLHHLHQQHSKPYHHQHQQITTGLPLALNAASSSPSQAITNKQNSPQPNNHHNNASLPPPHNMNHVQAPFMKQNRRTLERSNANLQYPPLPNQQSHHHHSGTTLDSADGITIRTPSLRRTRRISGSTNNNVHRSGDAVDYVPSSPRIQRSPIPSRAAVAAAVIKRNRLGSHTENMSSGSLNSIEV